MIKGSIRSIALSVSSGLTPSRTNPSYWNNGTIPWLKTEQLGERFIFDTNEKISVNALEETGIRVNPVDTLSIAMYGEGRTRGNVSLLKRRMTTNQACCNVVLDPEKASPEFVYYCLKNQYANLRRLSSGVRKNLNSGDIKDFVISMPELVLEQSRIAEVLSALDSKIELNNRINLELEAMAKLLYDYWFVQFDFPMTKAQAGSLGRPRLEGQPYRSSCGRMVYNSMLKREIPEKWEVGSLLKIAQYTNGIACQKFRAEGAERLPVIKIKEMRDGFTSATEFVRATVPSKVRIDDGDVLFSWSASLDVILWAGGRGALNQHIFKVVSDTHPRSFFYHQLRDYLAHFKMLADLRKTTMGHITQEHLEQSRISIPPDCLLETFDAVVDPILEAIIVNQKQNQELKRLRDWLLPMLMNGQVTVG